MEKEFYFQKRVPVKKAEQLIIMEPVVLTNYERIAIVQTRAMMLKTDMRPFSGFKGEPSTCPVELAVQEYDQGVIPFVLTRKRVDTPLSTHYVPDCVRVTRAAFSVLDSPEMRLPVD